jgi:predicted Zn-dependent protease
MRQALVETSMGWGSRLRHAVLAASALALLAGCAVNPATGKREFSLVSQDQELAIGAEGHEAIVAEYGLYGDAALAARVDSIGQALARRSELPNLQWHFTLLDDAAVNAFALPGGYIYITRGILAHLNSDAQLAGVLGHEIGHVTARHSAQRLTYQQLAGLGLGIASIASETFARYGELAQTGMQLMFLKYGRDDENQADDLGVRYSVAAGYDAREIPSTYTMLKRTGERAGQSLPGFLSTHPDPGDRETRTRALATAAVAGQSGLIINGRSFVQSLDRLSYGTNPRHGFFEGDAFYHPELRFQMRFPAGWAHQNTQSAVLAGTQDQKAVMQLTLAAAGDFTPEGYVAELQRRGSIAGASGGAETIGGYRAWVGILRTVSNQTETRLAAAFVRQAPDRMFQILGRSAAPGDANEGAILASARSIRALTDAGRLAAQPARVSIVSVAEAGTFESIVAAQGAQAIDLDETAILNNAWPDEQVQRRQLVKIVKPGKLQ